MKSFFLALIEFVNRYPIFYTDISATTLPNRLGMLLKLRHRPEVYDRLIFGTNYPLSVFYVPLWEKTNLITIRQMIQTMNRFDRQ